jgi:hypothetical protein
VCSKFFGGSQKFFQKRFDHDSDTFGSKIQFFSKYLPLFLAKIFSDGNNHFLTVMAIFFLLEKTRQNFKTLIF